MKTEKRLSWKVPDDHIRYCYNKKKEFLGYLEYERVGKWMHWCWYQFEGIRMSPGCLQEVRDKQKELFNLKKHEEKTKKLTEFPHSMRGLFEGEKKHG